jgi:uncharacterized protein
MLRLNRWTGSALVSVLVLTFVSCGKSPRVKSVAESATAEPLTRHTALDEKMFLEKVKGGDDAAVKAFLAAGVSPNARNEYGLHALTLAVDRRHLAVVALLLEAKADVNANLSGMTALSYAAMHGDPAIVQALLEYGASVKIAGGHDALWHACYEGHTDVALLLIKAGADVNGDNGADETGLHTAAIHGKAETVEALIGAGADVNAKDRLGDTALMAAVVAEEGAEEVVRVLLNANADAKTKNNRGQTALDIALQQHNADVAALLRGE